MKHISLQDVMPTSSMKFESLSLKRSGINHVLSLDNLENVDLLKIPVFADGGPPISRRTEHNSLKAHPS